MLDILKMHPRRLNRARYIGLSLFWVAVMFVVMMIQLVILAPTLAKMHVAGFLQQTVTPTSQAIHMSLTPPILTSYIGYSDGANDMTIGAQISWLQWISMGVSLLIFLFVTINKYMLSVRRLNDCNISGWWLFACLIPLIGLVFLIMMVFVPGTWGVNRYGDDPLKAERAFKASRVK